MCCDKKCKEKRWEKLRELSQTDLAGVLGSGDRWERWVCLEQLRCLPRSY